MTGERLLIVSTNEEIRKALTNTLLKPEGFEVLAAKTGAEGLKRALADHPNVIITDYRLPDITGLEMLFGIEGAGARIPAILIKEDNSADVVIDALRSNAIDSVQMPLDPDQLLTAVQRGLTQARSAPGTGSALASGSASLSSLLDVSQAIAASLDLEIVLSQVVDEAVRLSGAEEGILMLVDPQTEELFTRASKSGDKETIGNLRLPVEDSLAGRVVNTGKPLLIAEGKHKIKTQYLVKSLLYVPLILRDQIIGVLGVTNRTSEHYFSPEEVQALSVLANYAAIAIDNALAFEELEIERARFRSLLASSSDAMLVIDEEGYIILINQGACEALGVETLDALGRTVPDITTNADLRGLFERTARRPITRGEVNLSDGRTLNTQITAIEGMGAIAVMQDITHLKELDRMKTQFVTTVSHDLRSPLTAILGYIEFIGRAGPVNEQQTDFISRVKSSVNTMTNLINDLLDLGRIEAGMDREKEPVKVDPILVQLREALQSRYEAKQQQFTFECPEKLPQVFGNPLRLQQAFSNLIDNAIKYTPEGGDILLSANTTGEHVIVLVRDTGVGIPLSDQPYIFDQFYRAESVLESHQGTGLGLAIVKTIIEAHEGRIWVESKPKEGTTFTIMLPAYQPGKGLTDSPRAP